ICLPGSKPEKYHVPFSVRAARLGAVVTLRSVTVTRVVAVIVVPVAVKSLAVRVKVLDSGRGRKGVGAPVVTANAPLAPAFAVAATEPSLLWMSTGSPGVKPEPLTVIAAALDAAFT